MHDPPLSFDEYRFKVVIRIAAFFSWSSVANFKVQDILGSFIDQAVTVACAHLKTRAHSRKKIRSTFIGVERRLSLENVYKLVLLGVRVPKSRDSAGRQPREVYTKVREAKKIAERALCPA
jgi:hypothetical protein